MFLFLSKFLPLFVYPLGLACTLIVLALLIRRKSRIQMVTLVLALLLLWVGGNRWVSMSLVRSLEWQYLPPDPVPSAEVIVLLGGSTEAPLYPRPIVEINSAGDRVLYAAYLYHQSKAAHILVTGKRLDWSGPSGSPTEEMAAILEMLGVPRQAIWMEPDSLNTYEDALYSWQILDEKGIHRILLVTSAMHMPRAVGLFKHQGFEVIPAPTDFTVTQAGWQQLTRASLPDQLISLLPNASNLNAVSTALKEYLGILVYRLRGWL